MLNQYVAVGRMVNEIHITEDGSDEKVAIMTLAVPRMTKNSDGLYDTDFIDFTLSEPVAINTKEYCNVGDIVGVKGKIKSRTQLEDKTPMEIVAEKVTFLSSKKEN